MEETDVSDSSDAEEKDRLGEKLFSLVEEMDPVHANDITGDLTSVIQNATSLQALLIAWSFMWIRKDI